MSVKINFPFVFCRHLSYVVHKRTLINEEWRVEKSKKSINVEGGFLFCGGWNFSKSVSKVIREKSRGEGSLIEQDTIENVSEPKFFF